MLRCEIIYQKIIGNHFYFFMKKFCFHRNAKVTDNGTHANVTFMNLGASGNDLATCDSHEPPIFSLKGP